MLIFVSLSLLKFPQSQIDSYYLEHVINSPLVREMSEKGTEGIGNKNLVLRKIRLFLIPLPPLNEQHRIVAKVDELMRLCDALETQVKDGEKYAGLLLDAVLREAFDG